MITLFMVRGLSLGDDRITYEGDVRAVLKKRCGACHAGSQLRGELDLSSWSGIKAGSVSGPVVVAGKPDESLLYTLSAHLEAPKMPPNSPRIPQRELDIIRRWIEGGLARIDSLPGGDDSVAANSGKKSEWSIALPIPQSAPPTALAVSPAAPIVAVSGLHQVLLLDMENEQKVSALPFRSGDVHVLKFSQDGTRLLAAGGSGAVEGTAIAFDTESGQKLFQVGDETDLVLAADWTKDGHLVALGGPSRTVSLYDSRSGERLHQFGRHTDWILSVAFSPDGLLLASGDRFGGLEVWEASTGKHFFTLAGHRGAVTSLRWVKDADLLMSASTDGTIRLWDMHTGVPVNVTEGNIGEVLAAEIDPQNRILAGGREAEIAVLDGRGGAKVIATMQDQVVELGYSPIINAIVAADSSGRVAVLAAADGRLVKELKLPIDSDPVQAAVIRPTARKRPEGNPSRSVSTNSTEAESADLIEELRRTRAALESLQKSVKELEQRVSKIEQDGVQ